MRRAWVWSFAVALAASGCQGPGRISAAEIPERRILVRWLDAEEARDRAEVLADSQQATIDPGREGIARMKDLSSFMGRVLGVVPGSPEASLERRFPGRMAFLDPRTGRVEVLRSARPGAVPRSRSGDGERLIFSQLVGAYRQLFEYRFETGEVRRLTRGPDVHADGCHGPDGRIVMLSARAVGDRAESYVELMGEAGEAPIRISEGPADWGVACAPDGSAVAWSAIDARGRDILMTRSPVVGGELRRLGPGRDAAFSPDSEWIVYSARSGDTWELFRIRADGSGRRAVGRSTLDCREPSFAPDGRMVAYVADDRVDRRIYLRRFDGTGDRVLLEDGGGTDPVW